ncbi:MAG: hypothetical protein RIQ89_1441 [Bacteroidota bacterium]|jgi:iron complex outermembrane receptor protein
MIKNYIRKLLPLVIACFMSAAALAQSGTVTGIVVDGKGESIPGATVRVEGSSQAVSTDMDGKFTLSNVKSGEVNIVVSSIGMATTTKRLTVVDGKTTSFNFKLADGRINLDEAVVVGYGSTRKKDLTGTVTSIGEKEFNKGIITTPDQLVTGKVAGVKITSNGGAPGSGSRIRIRGGSSLSASNDPLIVIDGVPVDNNGISGSPNPLSLINPADIENITLLKDASAAAIYGARAANGVLIVTTKKGSSDKLKVEYNGSFSYNDIVKFVDVMDGDQFGKAVRDSGTANQIALLGNANTNWQDEIFQNSFTFNNNVSVSGGIKKLPYRLTLGVLNEDGILRRSELDRYSASLNLGPKFLNDKLSVDVNVKYSQTKSFFANQGAIGAAIAFDPTQTVKADSAKYLPYGGYFEWLDAQNKPITVATRNPVSLLEQRQDESTVNRMIGNINLAYDLPFVKGLKANLNLGTDISNGVGNIFVDTTAASDYFNKGLVTEYDQEKSNQLLDFYLVYAKDLAKIKSKLELTGGYSYQFWETSAPSFPNLNVLGDTVVKVGLPFFTQNALIGFYTRLNYSFKEKYLFTFNLRNDYSSRFSPDVRAGYFPSAAFAWRLSDEKFMSKFKNLSDFKVRLGYGSVGQQDINNDYAYIANYSQGTPTAQYQFGNVFYNVLRPDEYDPNLKWEVTTTYNAGIDYGFYQGRINGSIDLYQKSSTDLIAFVPTPAGTNFSNAILTNIGEVQNKGLEISLNVVPIAKKDVELTIGANLTYNKNEVIALSQTKSDTDLVNVGGIAGGVGSTIQAFAPGYSAFTFLAYNQLYDGNGKPLEGKYEDINGDGTINEKDLVLNGNPEPNIFVGLNANLRYKRWNIGFVMRGEFGSEMYNNVSALRSNFTSVGGSVKALNNLSTDYINQPFKTEQILSNYWIQDATFIRMDNINVAYQFKPLNNGKIGLGLSFTVQNAFVITKYDGIDPEIAGGIDNNLYPRPRIYTLGVNLKI